MVFLHTNRLRYQKENKSVWKAIVTELMMVLSKTNAVSVYSFHILYDFHFHLSNQQVYAPACT